MSATRFADRRGFALISVLWVIGAAAVLGLTVQIAARSALATSRNRAALTVGRWRAAECAARVRAAIASAFADASGPTPSRRSGTDPWAMLDRAIADAPELFGLPCTAQLGAVGARIDVNAADADLLRRALVNAGVRETDADSLADALLDWRDADDVPRDAGAERGWYVDRHRVPPRNGPIASVAELRRIRGFERLGGIDSLFGVEPGRIAIDRAPIAVLAALPGVGAEAAARIAERRARGRPVGDLVSLGPLLSAEARALLESHGRELAAVAVQAPDGWVLTTRVAVGLPPVETTLELRFARGGRDVAVVRRREWP
jgi:general secretion pathway protein K